MARSLCSARSAACQEIVNLLPLQQLDFDIGVVGQALPTGAGEFALKFVQGVSFGGEQIAAAGFAEEGQRLFIDHAAIHDPDALALAKARLDGVDDLLDGGEVTGVAGEGLMGQGKAVAGDDEGDDNLLAIAAMVAGVAAPGEFVFLGKAFEVTAGQVVEQQVVIELKERAEALLEIVLDGDLSFEQAVERAIEAVLGDGFVGNAQEIVERGGGVPVLGQSEFAAGLAQAIDDLDGDDVGGGDRLLALRDVAFDDAIEADILPQPACQPDIAEAPRVGPADFADADAHNVGIVGQWDVLVVGEKSKLLGIALAIVKDNGALPAAFFVVIEIAQMGNNALPRPGIGANAFDEGKVGMHLAILGPAIASEKHSRLPLRT